MSGEKQVYIVADPIGKTNEQKAAWVLWHQYLKEAPAMETIGQVQILHFAWYFADHMERYQQVLEAIRTDTFQEEIREE